MRERPGTDKSRLEIDAHFDSFTPEEMFEFWTQADLLRKWWPVEASTDPRPGGCFELRWPDFNWRLSGVYTDVLPPNRLGFTWNWDHDPVGTPERRVSVTFTASEEGGTGMYLVQEPFGESEAEQGARKGIYEGWLHFGMRLAGLREGGVNLDSSESN